MNVEAEHTPKTGSFRSVVVCRTPCVPVGAGDRTVVSIKANTRTQIIPACAAVIDECGITLKRECGAIQDRDTMPENPGRRSCR